MIVTIPHTRWWMCVPPTVTFPGHHFTCARIMCALVRMNPNVIRNVTKNRNSGWRPVSTIARSYRLEMLARVNTVVTLRHEHDLADVAALLDHAVCVGGPVEGEGLGDDGLERAVIESLEEG